MTGGIRAFRFIPLLLGASLLFLINHYAIVLLSLLDLLTLPMLVTVFLFIYGFVFLACDWLRERAAVRRAIYFFFRGACLGALCVVPYVARLVANSTNSPVSTAVLLIVGAVIIFIGHILTRIMFSPVDEKG